jgi:hypothetical protein
MVKIFNMVHRTVGHPVSTQPTYTNAGTISGKGLDSNDMTSNTIVGYSGRDSVVSTDNSQKVYGSGVLNLTNDRLIRQSPITKNTNKEVLIRTKF